MRIKNPTKESFTLSDTQFQSDKLLSLIIISAFTGYW